MRLIATFDINETNWHNPINVRTEYGDASTATAFEAACRSNPGSISNPDPQYDNRGVEVSVEIGVTA